MLSLNLMNEKDVEIREEKVCQNCQSPITGNFCAECGQKANLHKDSFWHMIAHFAGDYFHYDSKLWVTLKTLLFQPGKITLEYNQGKRAKYLNPIQLYIFITTVFFIFYFSLSKTDDKDSKVQSLNKSIKDTSQQVDANKSKFKLNGDSMDIQFGNGSDLNFKSIAAYDSIQNALPASKKDNWIEQIGKKKLWKLNKKYPSAAEFNHAFYEKLTHNVPKVFFILLPFFALLLMIIFFKHKIYYIDHLIFSLHFHTVLFILLGFLELLKFLLSGLDIIGLINTLFFVIGSIYLFLALKKVYPNKSIYIIMQQLILFSLYTFGFLIALVFLMFATLVLL